MLNSDEEGQEGSWEGAALVTSRPWLDDVTSGGYLRGYVVHFENVPSKKRSYNGMLYKFRLATHFN